MGLSSLVFEIWQQDRQRTNGLPSATYASPICPAGIGSDLHRRIVWRCQECGLWLLAIELSALLVPHSGTACRATSSTVRLLTPSVDDLNISYLLYRFLDNSLLLIMSIPSGPWGLYLGHFKNLYTIQYNTTWAHLTLKVGQKQVSTYEFQSN